MKILRAVANNHKGAFEVTIGHMTYSFPYARAEPTPTSADPIRSLIIDPELGREGITYVLQSGQEGSILADWVLDHNCDPEYLRELLLYNLTVNAQDHLAETPLSTREIIRRLKTSASQFYRLIDQTNYRKSVDQVLALLQVLDCEVEVTVRARRA